MRFPDLPADKFMDGQVRARLLESAAGHVGVHNVPMSPETMEIKVPRIHRPPPEATPVGRAAIESAEARRQGAKTVEVLAVIVAELNHMLVT